MFAFVISFSSFLSLYYVPSSRFKKKWQWIVMRAPEKKTRSHWPTDCCFIGHYVDKRVNFCSYLINKDACKSGKVSTVCRNRSDNSLKHFLHLWLQPKCLLFILLYKHSIADWLITHQNNAFILHFAFFLYDSKQNLGHKNRIRGGFNLNIASVTKLTTVTVN